MINIKIFKTEQEYLNSEKLFPQISNCLDTDRLWIEGQPVLCINEIVLKVKGRGSSPIVLYKGGMPSSDFVSSVMVDDIRQPLSPGLILNDNKEHIVRLGMLQDCNTLKGLFCLDDSENNTSEIDFTNFNFSSVKDVSYLFGNVSITNNNLKNIIWGDGTNLEGASFTNVAGLYCGCSSINNFNYSIIKKATGNDFSYMFYNCKALKTMLNFPWNNRALNCTSMFQNCSTLEDVSISTLGENSNVTDMFNNVKHTGSMPYWDESKKQYQYGRLQIQSWYGSSLSSYENNEWINKMKGGTSWLLYK